MAVKQLPAAATNIDAPVRTELVNVSAADYTPTNGEYIRAINCSTAGLLYLTDLNGTTAPEYMNLGWNPCTVCATIKYHASNVAVPIKAGLAKLTCS